jgi:hypothetical protein
MTKFRPCIQSFLEVEIRLDDAPHRQPGRSVMSRPVSRPPGADLKSGSSPDRLRLEHRGRTGDKFRVQPLPGHLRTQSPCKIGALCLRHVRGDHDPAPNAPVIETQATGRPPNNARVIHAKVRIGLNAVILCAVHEGPQWAVCDQYCGVHQGPQRRTKLPFVRSTRASSNTFFLC